MKKYFCRVIIPISLIQTHIHKTITIQSSILLHITIHLNHNYVINNT